MNGAVANVLNSVLGTWVDNINSDQLKLSVFSGEVVLKDLRLKESAIESLGFPFKLKSGGISSLKVDIPWSKLGSAPLKIEISGIYALVSPSSPGSWSEEKEKEKVKLLKRSLLDNYEAITSSELSVSEEKGFFEKLVNKIVMNVQVSIKKVYLVYDDEITSSHRFVAGVFIQALSAYTTDSDWKPQFIESGDVNYKLAKLEGFRVFLDENWEMGDFEDMADKEVKNEIRHSYILNPTTFKLKMRLNLESRSSSEFLYCFQLSNKDIALGVDTLQLKHVMKVLEFMNSFDGFCKGISNTLIEPDLREDLIENYREKYKKFRIADKRSPGKSKKERAELEAIEASFNVYSLIHHRKYIDKQLELLNKEESIKEEIKRTESEESGTFSKISSFLWGKSKSQQKEDEENRKEKISKMNERLSEILNEQNKLKEEMSRFVGNVEVQKYAKEFTLYLIQLNIEQTKLIVKDNTQVISFFEIDGIAVEARIRSASLCSVVEIRELFIKNTETGDYLLKGKTKKIEYDDLDQTVFRLDSEGMVIIADIEWLFRLNKSFSDAFSETDTQLKAKYWDQMTETTNKYLELGQNYMKDFIQNGSNSGMQLFLNVTAPVIFLPFDLKSANLGFLLVDFGKIAGKSGMIDENNFKFNCYKFGLSQFKISAVGPSESFENWHKKFELLQETNCDLTVKMCTVVQYEIASINTSISFSPIHLNLSDTALEDLIKLYALVLKNMPEAEESKKDQVEVVESYKDQMKKFKQVIGIQLEVLIGEFSIKIIEKDRDLVSFFLNSVFLCNNLVSDGTIISQFSVQNIDMVDLREFIKINKLVSNPFTGQTDEEFPEEDPQIKIISTLKPKDDILDIGIYIADIRFVAESTVIIKLSAFFLAPLQFLPPAPESPNKTVASQYETVFNTRVLIQLSNIETWLPLTTETDSKRTGYFFFNGFVEYRSIQRYVLYFNSDDEEINKLFISIQDEASVELTNIGGYVGMVNKNRVVLSEERVYDLLPPIRVGLSYTCTKEKEKQQVTKYSINLESIQVEIGFRDLQFFQKFIEKWSSFAISTNPSEPGLEVLQSDEKTCISVDSDSFRLTLLEDTGVKAYSLLYFHLSSLKLCSEIENSKSQGSFSTFLYSDYYNLKLSAWEPFIENWNVYAEAIQTDSQSPLRVSVTSPTMLNINITMSMLETFGTLSQKLGENSSFWAEDQHKEKVLTDQNELLAHGQFFYNIENMLGVPISVWLDLPKTDVDDWKIAPGQSQMFSFHQLKEKINQSSLRKGLNNGITEEVQAPIGLCLNVEGYSQVKGLFFEKTGVRGFVLSAQDKKIYCSLNIFAKDNLKIIRIETSVLVVNNTYLPIVLRHGKNDFEIDIEQCWPVPLRWLVSSEKPTILAQEPVNLLENKYFKMISGEWAVQTITKYKTLNNSIFQTVVMINPALWFENLLPGLMRVYLNRNENPDFVINSGGSSKFYKINPNELKDLKIQVEFLNEEEQFSINSEWVSFNRNKKTINFNGNFAGKSVFIETLDADVKKGKGFDFSMRKEVEENEEKIKGLKIEFYSPYILVNRTDLHLEILDCKRGVLCKPHSQALLKKPKLRLRITKEKFGEASELSKDFNIDAIGISGCITLPFKKQEKVPKEYILGLSVFTAAVPLIKSKIVTVAPRFFINNTLSFDILIKQFFKDRESEEKVTVKSGQSASYNLENSEISRTVQISKNGTDWSSPFSIQNIEDFQVKVKSDSYEDTSNWFHPTQLNNNFNFIRVFVTTQDQATLHTYLAEPVQPEFCINNLSSEYLTIRQEKFDPLTIPPATKLPWAFDDLTKPKVLLILIDGKSKEVNIDRVQKSKKLGRFRIEVRVIGAVRELTISLTRGSIDSDISVIEPKTIWKVALSLRGVGFSVIDHKPSELIYISAIEIESKLREREGRDAKRIQKKHKFYISVGKFQIDNMQAKGKHFFMIFGPSKSDETVPMIQFEVDKASYTKILPKNRLEKDSIDRYSWVELAIQEMKLTLDQDLIENLLEFASLAVLALNFVKPFKPYPLKLIPMHEICENLNAKDPSVLISDITGSSKLYFKLLRFCAIKILVSFRKSAKKGQSLDPRNGFGLLTVAGMVGGAFVNISDSPLSFKELLIQESFQTVSLLSSQIIKNYSRQGILQFYKILGSSDLIGNPVGLIDKLGTGVLEFINEPAKGVIKGPKAFAEGVTKGVRSLVGNIVAGSFGSVSKITGNLYGLVREVGGDAHGAERINDSDNAFNNIFQGIKGGVIDLAEGVTGIFTKPWKGAKRGGAKGFFKGIGSGLLGAVTSPLSAALRIGSGISTGFTNAALFLAKGKVSQMGRVRFPRHFSPLEVLEPYNWEVAEAKDFLNSMEELRKEQIVFYMRMNEEECLIIIVTLNYFLFIVETNLIQKIELRKINGLEVHKPNDNVFYLRLATMQEETLTISSQNYSPLIKLYAAVTSMIEPPKPSPAVKKILAPNRYGNTCCRPKKTTKSASKYSISGINKK